MNQFQKRGALCICGCMAAGVLLLDHMPGAGAYFTSYASAGGQIQLALGPTTTSIEELESKDFEKHIIIHNTGDFDCFVRVKLFFGSFIQIEDFSGDHWYREGGYYVYNEVLPAGGESSELDVSFKIPEGYREDFNVIVVEESCQVLYDAKTGLPYADWNQKISTDIGFYSGEAGE